MAGQIGRAALALLAVAGVVAGLVAVASAAPPVAQGLPLALAALCAAGLVALRVTRSPVVVDVPLDTPSDRLPGAVGDAARSPVTRRAVVAGAGALGAGGLALAWFGPERPATSRWAPGTHVVDPEGRRILAAQVPLGGQATVWPEGAVDDEGSSAILVRLTGGPPLPPTDLEGVVEPGLVAYSKICTHAGCPVGLLRTGDDALYCPCHQATFDARRGAVPVFGPASLPLPQLPLGVDDEGYLVALAGFLGPVGPPRG